MNHHSLRFLKVIVLGFLFVYGSAFADDPKPWPANVETLDGTLELLLSVLERHPTIIASNLEFKRNPIDNYQDVSSLLKRLGENAASTDIGPTEFISSEYSSQTGLDYSQAKIKELKDQLSGDKNLGLLEKLLTGDVFLTSLKNDISRIQDANGLKALFRLLPFLYDTQTGEANIKGGRVTQISILWQWIESATASDLENRYGDMMDEHYEKLVKEQLKEADYKVFRDINQGFAKNVVIKEKLAKYVGDKKAKVRKLAIQVMPNLIGVIRGSFGKDCSNLSADKFALHKKAKPMWIWQGEPNMACPDGYVFVVEATTSQGEKLPYLITPNAPFLNEADTVELMRMIAFLWERDQQKTDPNYKLERMIVADFDYQKDPQGKGINYYLTNYPSIRNGIQNYVAANQGQNDTVSLPEGWELLEKYMGEHSRYVNYYARERLQHAVVVPLKPTENVQKDKIKTRLLYQEKRDIPKMPLLERALLGAYALVHQEEFNYKEEPKIPVEYIQEFLKINEKQLKLGQRVLEVVPVFPIDLATYKELQTVFSIKSDFLERLDALSRAASIKKLYEEEAKLFQPKEWQRLSKDTHRSLNLMLDQAYEAHNTGELAKIITAKLQLPFPSRSETARSLYKHSSRTVREYTVGALKRIGEKAIPELIEAISESNSEVRNAGLEALGSLSEKDSSIMPFLIKMLKDPNAKIRAQVAWVLGRRGEFASDAIPALTEALKDQDHEVRGAAAVALGTTKAVRAIPDLMEALYDPDFGVRTGALQALGDIGKKSSVAIPLLVKILHEDPDGWIRTIITLTLGKMGKEAAPAVPSLIKALSDKHYEVRQGAATALGKIGQLKSEAIRALIRTLNDVYPDVRQAAAVALGKMGEAAAPAVPRLIHLLKQSQSQGVVVAVVEALGEIGKPAKRSLKTLKGVLQSATDPDVEDAAKAAIQKIQTAIHQSQGQRPKSPIKDFTKGAGSVYVAEVLSHLGISTWLAAKQVWNGEREMQEGLSAVYYTGEHSLVELTTLQKHVQFMAFALAMSATEKASDKQIDKLMSGVVASLHQQHLTGKLTESQLNNKLSQISGLKRFVGQGYLGMMAGMEASSIVEHVFKGHENNLSSEEIFTDILYSDFTLEHLEKLLLGATYFATAKAILKSGKWMQYCAEAIKVQRAISKGAVPVKMACATNPKGWVVNTIILAAEFALAYAVEEAVTYMTETALRELIGEARQKGELLRQATLNNDEAQVATLAKELLKLQDQYNQQKVLREYHKAQAAALNAYKAQLRSAANTHFGIIQSDYPKVLEYIALSTAERWHKKQYDRINIPYWLSRQEAKWMDSVMDTLSHQHKVALPGINEQEVQSALKNLKEYAKEQDIPVPEGLERYTKSPRVLEVDEAGVWSVEGPETDLQSLQPFLDRLKESLLSRDPILGRSIELIEVLGRFKSTPGRTLVYKLSPGKTYTDSQEKGIIRKVMLEDSRGLGEYLYLKLAEEFEEKLERFEEDKERLFKHMQSKVKPIYVQSYGLEEEQRQQAHKKVEQHGTDFYPMTFYETNLFFQKLLLESIKGIETDKTKDDIKHNLTQTLLKMGMQESVREAGVYKGR